MSSQTLFDFSQNSNLHSWRVVNDDVMGGKSVGNFELSDEGHGLFYGEVSTENNGGFSSVRWTTSPIEIGDHTKIAFRLRGDGKDYQFRLKEKTEDRPSYISSFHTTGEWQIVEVAISELYPSFRGRRLEMPNFEASSFEECAFLIANKQDESFRLEIDWIELR
ncbi:MAG: CIA30 family protein [Flavobacteriia bacterium]|nr:CIA30 family protein [Flavobacteriia bacterium]